jgi:hypothetical protein
MIVRATFLEYSCLFNLCRLLYCGIVYDFESFSVGSASYDEKDIQLETESGYPTEVFSAGNGEALNMEELDEFYLTKDSVMDSLGFSQMMTPVSQASPTIKKDRESISRSILAELEKTETYLNSSQASRSLRTTTASRQQPGFSYQKLLASDNRQITSTMPEEDLYDGFELPP